MRVLLPTIGTRGDVQPMVALALALKDAGHEAIVCAPQRFEAWIASHQVPMIPLGLDPDALLEAEKSLGRMRALLREDLARQFERLAELAQDADQIVSTTLVMAAPSVAELRGIPHTSAVFVAQALPSGDHPFPAIPTQTLPRWLNRASWWLGTRAYGALALPLVNAHRRRLGLRPHARISEAMFGQQVLLAADPIFAPTPADVRMPVDQTGAWTMKGPAPSAELEAFLAAGPPPIYVGFGSNLEEDAKQVRAAVERAGARAILSMRSPAETPHPDVFHLTGDVDHAQLFPRCRLVVHHGGAGTTTTAAQAGVPQWIVAHRGDQHAWAHHVKRLGLGPEPTTRKRFSAEALAAAIAAAPHHQEASERLARALISDGTRRAVTILESRATTTPPTEACSL